MAAILPYSIPITIVTNLIGQEFLSNTVKDMTDSIYKITYSGYPELDYIISKLDIKTQIKMINSFINNLNKEKTNETINIGLNSLHQSLCEINHNLLVINQCIKKDKLRYLNKYRKPSYTKFIKKLVNDKKILHERLELLISFLQVKDLLYKNNDKKNKCYLIQNI